MVARGRARPSGHEEPCGAVFSCQGDNRLNTARSLTFLVWDAPERGGPPRAGRSGSPGAIGPRPSSRRPRGRGSSTSPAAPAGAICSGRYSSRGRRTPARSSRWSTTTRSRCTRWSVWTAPSTWAWGGRYCAINPNLTQKWCKPLIADVSPNAAAVDVNGYIYVGDRDNTFYKLRPDGTRVWTYNNGHEGDINSSPAIAARRQHLLLLHLVTERFGVVAAISQSPAIPSQCMLKSTFETGESGDEDLGGDRAERDDRPRLRRLAGRPSRTTARRAALIADRAGRDDERHVVAGARIGRHRLDRVNDCFHALDPADGPVEFELPTLGVVATGRPRPPRPLFFVASPDEARTVYAISPGDTCPRAAVALPEERAVDGNRLSDHRRRRRRVRRLRVRAVPAFDPTDGRLLWSKSTARGIISAPLIGLPGPGQLPATPTQSGTAVLVIGSPDHMVYARSCPRTALTQDLPPEPRITVDPGPSSRSARGDVPRPGQWPARHGPNAR